MGVFHAHTVAQDRDSELVYVCDIDEERAATIGQKLGAPVLVTPSLDVDAIIVASPTDTHARFARLAAEAGVAALLEKPVALASHLSAAVARYPQIYIGHCERFNPAFDRIRLPVSGRLHARRLAPPTRRSRDIDVVLDLMIHDLDLLLYLGGDFISVEIERCVIGSDGIDELSVDLLTRSGISASLVASRVSDYAERTWRFPNLGVHLDLLAVNRSCHPGATSGEADALQRQWAAFKTALEGESTAIATAADGHRAVLAAERICQLVSGYRRAWAS
jgi:predicted dehydrogenase